jgi:hypothetical protein
MALRHGPAAACSRALFFSLLAGLPASPAAQPPSAQVPRPPDRVRFLTSPSPADPLEIVRAHIRRNRAALRLEADDLVDWTVRDRYVTRHSGATHLYLRQRFRGIEVFNADISVTTASDGRMIGLGNRFVAGLARSINVTHPLISAVEAVERAAEHLGLDISEPLRILEGLGGPAQAVRISDGGMALDAIPAKLMYLPRESGRVRLVWNLVLRPRDGQHWWNLHVDAVTGAVLSKNDYIDHDRYRVYALPLQNPHEGPRTLEIDPADTIASPYGWHDIDGIAGPEFTDTAGNNVVAQEDVNGNNRGGFSPDVGSALNFDFPLNLSLEPEGYRSAAITNLFYWNNLLHDIHYRYGFDEASGNFQENNYGNGGLGEDPVIADAQDGSDFDNATFATLADGIAPRMQLFIWLLGPLLNVHSPASISGDYAAGRALFGPALTHAGITGEIVQALDPADANGPSVTDACSPLTNAAAISGKIALVDRRPCLFIEKVANAQDAGAIGVIIANTEGDQLETMGGVDPSIVIPSLFIGQSDGDLIKAELAAGVSASLSRPVRDSDLDSGIIIHEYGHGISERLTGGASSADCLIASQSAGMAEGWSDWWALALTAVPGESGGDPRGIATYLEGQSSEEPGIRRFPYSTDLAVNPLTFGDIAISFRVHDTGEIWAATLWELYWNLVATHGFDPDLYAGNGGNNLALQLVMDGLKLQPCTPTFLEARDAILSADLMNNDGRNRCPLWAAFAKRGMGVNAQDGGSANSQSVTEDFELPQECGLCGDVNGDGEVNLVDGVILQRALRGLAPGMLVPERCNIAGPADLEDDNADGRPDDCDATDLETLRKHLAGLPPGISPVCAPPAVPAS